MPLFAAPAMHLTDVPLKLAEIWSMPGTVSDACFFGGWHLAAASEVDNGQKRGHSNAPYACTVWWSSSAGWHSTQKPLMGG